MSKSDSTGLSYRDAGVDLDAADRAKNALKALVESTRDVNTLSELGSFGGLYRVPGDTQQPVLVSSADGVGTKLKVAFQTGRHDSVGRDLVNHCVNDILVQGARPLFFLDYLATGEMDENVVSSVVRGIAVGCRDNECALLGGETAQMADFYTPGEYDLAGFIVGIVEQAKILDGSSIQAGDALIGLASDGLHTNGYTLARAIVFEHMEWGVEDPFPGENDSVGGVLLRGHRSYLKSLLPLLDTDEIHGLAHVTGSGIGGNLPRVLPAGLGASVDMDSWQVPGVFRVLQDAGSVDSGEMFRVFNMGVGMIAVVAPERADSVIAALRGAGETAWLLGRTEHGEGVRFSR
jgi:phosphoribosylformylglycinamidine cyclo-ligase